MVTLTGPAGVGKTRLALAIAEGLVDRFDGSIHVVELAEIANPALAIAAMAQSLGFDLAGQDVQPDDLIGRLAAQPTLMVLDNCEQVLPVGAALAELLAACPELRLLATSREPLRLRWEHLVAVSPLPVPDLARSLDLASPLDLAELARIGAVALFVAQAQAVRHDFALTLANARIVAELCARLDGLPLALELAAARVTALTPAEILARLESRLTLLRWDAQDAPPRHRTLRTAIGWSYDLLSADEQLVFRRLGVFSGGCTLGDGLWVLGDGGESPSPSSPKTQHLSPKTLDVLISLAEKNMLVASSATDHETRFGMLDSMREFAREQLVATGELDAARRRHAAVFLDLAEQAEPELIGPAQARWLGLLEQEHGNLRGALAWAAEQVDGTTLLRLSSAVWRFWWMCGHLREGERWLEQALASSELAGALRAGEPADALGSAGLTDALRARALDGYGTIKQGLGDYEHARRLLEAALAVARLAQDRPTEASALVHLGMGAQLQGDDQRAADLFESGLAVYREAGDAWGSALALRSLGLARRRLGDPAAAEHCLAEAIELFRAVGDVRARALALTSLASLAGARGDLSGASALLAESISLGRSLGDNARIIAACADVSAMLNAQRAAPEQIVRLLAGAERLRQRSAIGRGVREREARSRRIESLRSHLSEAELATGWAAGTDLTIDQLVGLILAIQEPARADAESGTSPARQSRQITRLSPREREVLSLVATGLTTRQIADALTVAERTVRFHVASVLQKLGTSTRAQAVAVAVQRGLL
jgi:predicted ATPase/DNA-binding CsgD family transcriptional regulator